MKDEYTFLYLSFINCLSSEDQMIPAFRCASGPFQRKRQRQKLHIFSRQSMQSFLPFLGLYLPTDDHIVFKLDTIKTDAGIITKFEDNIDKNFSR